MPTVRVWSRRVLESEIARPLILIVAVFVLWDVTIRIFRIPPYLIPAPWDVAKMLVAEWPRLWRESLYTAYATLGGFGLSILLGIPIAMLIAYSRVVESFVYPLLVFSQSIPKIAIAERPPGIDLSLDGKPLPPSDSAAWQGVDPAQFWYSPEGGTPLRKDFVRRHLGVAADQPRRAGARARARGGALACAPAQRLRLSAAGRDADLFGRLPGLAQADRRRRADLMLKRQLRSDGRAFPRTVFETRRFFESAV